jgi:hypothetical protein
MLVLFFGFKGGHRSRKAWLSKCVAFPLVFLTIFNVISSGNPCPAE